MFGILKKVDWYIVLPAIVLCAFSLFTLASFGEVSVRFVKQLVWVCIGVFVCIAIHKIDLSFLKNRKTVLILYAISIVSLLLLFVAGHVAKGAQSWIRLGFLSIQPTDPAKLILIILLAKYFSKRYVEISAFRHVLVSGLYTAVLGGLVLLQPDFGSAVTIFAIWLGMIFVSGISKKHLVILGFCALTAFGFAWQFAFKDYQKKRVINFIHPMSDTRGSGYNQYQALIAIGSGEWLGKGVGYGTQSKLRFLPEYQTDFIIAAFAEEWGFVGLITVLILFGLILTRLLYLAPKLQSNFEVLCVAGIVFFLGTHVSINIGMNLGVMPVTGIPLPFMSYGGSHILIDFIAIGIASNFLSHRKGVERGRVKNEFVGF